MSPELPEPSRSFLSDLGALVTHDVLLHCCGGFVVTMRYDLARTTADLDVLSRRCDTFRINRYQSAGALVEPPHLVFAGRGYRQILRRLADVRVPEPVLNRRERDAGFRRGSSCQPRRFEDPARCPIEIVETGVAHSRSFDVESCDGSSRIR